MTGEPRTWYSLARGPEGTTLEKFVQVHARRHGIEELLQRGKGEVGLADYEVRGWVGWRWLALAGARRSHRPEGRVNLRNLHRSETPKQQCCLG